MEDRKRVLDEITKYRDYKVALFSSFNFEIEYFERAILSKLYDNGIRKVSLFIDYTEFEKAVINLRDYSLNVGLGKKYIVSPVSISGAFHPKMVLLLGERKAKLIISSANIKTSGYEKNNEVYNVIDYSEKQSDYQDLIVEAIKYFTQIDSISFGLDSDLIKECKDFRYYNKCRKNEERYFLGNYEISILDQVKKFVPISTTREIMVAVPYFDDKTSALSQLQDLFPNAKISLFIQQERSTFPSEYEKKYRIRLFDKFNDNASCSFYHGKVFLFKTDEKDYILYGSANCTNSALTRTFRSGGNIECDLLDVGEIGEFDYFFDNLNILKDEKIISKPMIHEPNKKGLFRFVYAETTKNGVECHISGNKENNVDFIYNDYSFEYIFENGEYNVFIDKQEAEGLPHIFDLTVRVNDVEEVVRCWVIDRNILAANRRERSDKSDVENFEIDSDGLKYRDDRINLLNAELMCVEEVDNHRKMSAILNQQRIMAEEDETSASDDDFIVESELSYEYKVVFRRYTYVERIRGLFLQRFLHPSSFREERNTEDIKNSETDTGIEEKQNLPRKATTEEKRFERFVKARVKGVLNPKYIDMISFEHYMGIILVVTDIFSRYNNNENVIDIFKTDYVVKTKVEFIKLLLLKNYSDLDNREEYEQHIVVWAICSILENHLLIKKNYYGEDAYRLDSLDKELLKVLEKKYNIRSNLQDIIKRVYDPSFNCDYRIVNEYGSSKALTYIDGLYGYKSEEKLFDFIKQRYGKETIITIEKKCIFVDVTTNDIIRNLNPDTEVIREVATNVRNTNKDIKNLVIKILNSNKSKSRHIASIKHTISLDIYRKWNCIITYSDGRNELQSGRSIPNL